MNNLKSYTEYAVSTPTTDFVIGFDFNYGTDAVNVTVNGVPATEAGYTVVYLNSTTMRLTPAVTSGVVRLRRETDIDVPDNRFTAGAKFIASNMDENFTQIRHAQQEVRDEFDYLEYNTLGVVEAAKDATELANDAAARTDAKLAELQPTIDSKLREFDLAINTIVVGDGVPALAVSTASGENQQTINDYNGAKWRNKAGGYALHARVMLESGDIVKSTIDGNTSNPNLDLSTWDTGKVFVDARLFGLKADGVTDNRIALQKAVNYANSKGGGVVVLPSGTTIISSKTTEGGVNTNCLIKWKPNVSLVGVGESSVVKVGNISDSKFYLFYNPSQDLGNVQFYNFKIDGNGEQNVATASSGFDQWLIAIAQASTVRINKVFVYNAAGRQCFSIGTNSLIPTVKSVWISECNVYKVANDVAGNELQGDHSSIYVSSDIATIWANDFKNDSVLDQRATAIECQAISATIFGNTAENYNVGIITAAQIRSVDEHNIFGNTLKCRVAWKVYVSGGWDFKKLIFNANPVIEREESIGQQSLIELSKEVKNHVTGTVFITSNNITGSGKTISTAGMHAIAIGDIARVVVKGNDFKNIVGQVVRYGVVPVGADINFEFKGNTIDDCNTTTNANYKTAMAFFDAPSLNQLSIKGNTFKSSSSAFTNKILGGVSAVNDFTFADNEEVGSGIVNQITWSAGKLVKSNIQHTTKITSKPTIEVSIGSKITVASQSDGIFREYNRISGTSALPLWKTTHYISDGLPPSGFVSVHGDEAINTRPALGLPSKWLCTVAGTPGTWLPVGFIGTQTTTTEAMSSLTAEVNQLNKVSGKTVINSVDKKMYYATGGSAGSTWVSIDGVTTLTPV